MFFTLKWYMQIAIQSHIVNPDDALHDTLRIANRACQETIDLGLKHETWAKAELHKVSYARVREKYPTLNSSLVTAVRDQAADMLKRWRTRRVNPRKQKSILKTGPEKRPTSGIRLNHNTVKVFFDSSTVSLSTVEGRRKYTLSIPAYARERYTLGRCTAATLRSKRHRVFLDLIIEVEPPPPSVGDHVLGVDRGVYCPAVTSHAQFFHSKTLRNIKARYRHLKRCLQQAGTRNATRHLRRVAGRERRFVLDTNHVISKRIVAQECDAIAMEELEAAKLKKGHKRRRNTPADKSVRLLGSWSPRELQSFISYKAALAGKRIILVPPHYTSQACSRCGDIRAENRRGRLFRCLNCGFSLHADLNASRNIALHAKRVEGRQPVNLPNATYDDLKAFLRNDLRASIVASPPFLTGGN